MDGRTQNAKIASRFDIGLPCRQDGRPASRGRQRKPVQANGVSDTDADLGIADTGRFETFPAMPASSNASRLARSLGAHSVRPSL